MNETKFEPFIKGFMVLVVICAVIYAIAFASKEEAILKGLYKIPPYVRLLHCQHRLR